MDHNLDDPLNLDGAMGVDFETSGDQVVSQADISLDTGSHETSMRMEFEPMEEHPMLLDPENEQIIGYSDDQFSLQDYGMQQQDEDTGANTTVVTSEPSIHMQQSNAVLDITFDPQPFVSTAPKVESAQPKIITVKGSLPPRLTALKEPPRQVAIAPKPTLVKKLSLVQGSAQGKTLLAQIGKQLVMMPAGGGARIKLVSAAAPRLVRAGAQDQAQVITTKNISGTAKPMLTKFIIQGQPGDPANQPAVLTRLPARALAPLELPDKVLVPSPATQPVRITKKHQFIEIKSPSQKPQAASQAGGTKKVVITATPAQNIIYKTTGPVKTTAQTNKDGVVQGQRTQLHQINVPGKGIQYIRLVTNAPRLKPAPRAAGTLVLADAKGNVIQMAGEKVQAGQPPPLVISGSSAINKLTAKPQQRLVRIAPVGSKPAMAATQQSLGRSSQSLLAPLSPAPALAPADADCKAALRALVADAQPPPPQSPPARSRSSSAERAPPPDQPLIVIPNYLKPQDASSDDFADKEDGSRFNSFEAQSFNSYQAPLTPQALSETEVGAGELGMRPRKACNCTKSQCLKLYCDCFANGEFCNRCNCTNCHNNLEHEELRQKAIRGCLDRNPNAFRPKIGKAKSGGPEIVRRHNKGCNCKRSGCLKNYCECYEAKIACTAMCKCVGCRNVEATLERRRRERERELRAPALPHINFMTSEVIEAVCQCLVAAAAGPAAGGAQGGRGADAVRDVLDEFSRCLQDIIAAAHHAPLLDESRA